MSKLISALNSLEEVFCENCKYFDESFLPPVCNPPLPDVWEEKSYRSPRRMVKRLATQEPSELNKHNDCKYYKTRKAWWKYDQRNR